MKVPRWAVGSAEVREREREPGMKVLRAVRRRREGIKPLAADPGAGSGHHRGEERMESGREMRVRLRRRLQVKLRREGSTGLVRLVRGGPVVLEGGVVKRGGAIHW